MLWWKWVWVYYHQVLYFFSFISYNPHNTDVFSTADETKPEPAIEFIPPNESPTPPTPMDDTMKQLKEKELKSERHYRLRIHPRQNSDNLTKQARSLIHLRTSDNNHTVADVAKVFARPSTAASIPSKCR